MADDRRKRGKPDAIRINVGQRWELTYWTRKLRCSPAELRAAVKAVGPVAAAVQRHLKKERQGS